MRWYKIWLPLIIVVVLINLLLFERLFNNSKNAENLYNPSSTQSSDLKSAVIVVSDLKLVKKGDPFKDPIIQSNGAYALYNVNGRLQSLNLKDGLQYVAIVTDRGKPVYEVVPVSKNFKALLNDSSGGSVKVIDIDLNQIKQSDSLIVSYNINLKTKSVSIAGIQVSR